MILFVFRYISSTDEFQKFVSQILGEESGEGEGIEIESEEGEGGKQSLSC
jgi:hypothetical protein